MLTTAAIGAPVTGLNAASAKARTICAWTNSDSASCGRFEPGTKVVVNALTGSSRAGVCVSWTWMSEVCPR